MCSCLSSLSQVLYLVRGSDSVRLCEISLWETSSLCGQHQDSSLFLPWDRDSGDSISWRSLFQQSDSQREEDTSIFRLFFALANMILTWVHLCVCCLFLIFSVSTQIFTHSVSDVQNSLSCRAYLRNTYLFLKGYGCQTKDSLFFPETEARPPTVQGGATLKLALGRRKL